MIYFVRNFSVILGIVVIVVIVVIIVIVAAVIWLKSGKGAMMEVD